MVAENHYFMNKQLEIETSNRSDIN